MIRPLRPDSKGFIRWLAGADIKKGQICVLTGGECVPAAEGVNSAVILGVAVEDCDDTETAILYSPRQQFEAEFYQGSSTDVATAALLGTDFDIYVDGAAGDGSGEGEMYLDLNDTTGPMLNLLGYDNVRRVGIFEFIESLLYT
jgi:hypothetical protein